MAPGARHFFKGGARDFLTYSPLAPLIISSQLQIGQMAIHQIAVGLIWDRNQFDIKTNLVSNHADVAPTDQSDAVFINCRFDQNTFITQSSILLLETTTFWEKVKEIKVVWPRLISHLDLSRRAQLIVLTV